MKKIFLFLKLNQWRFLRKPSTHYPIILPNDNDKKAFTIVQTSRLFFQRYFESLFLKYKMDDETLITERCLVPPEAVRGMKKLDRSAFTKCIQVPVLVVAAQKVGNVIEILKPFLLKIRNFKALQEADHAEIKHIYLNPDSVRCFNDFKECKKVLTKEGINEKDLFWKSLNIGYENWDSDIILKSVLPLNQNVSSFSAIGHILHLNLKDHLADYKYIIGEVLLDKHKSFRTVVNKTSIINSKYRNFSMEILSGDNDMDACVKENGCTYKFDFSKVYWNSRLSTERWNIVSKLKKGDILFDVFAGVGPFSILAAKRGCTVLANDLNPDCFNCLRSNAELNKVAKRIEFFNMDGRDFIYQVVKARLLKIWEEKMSQNIHIVMNLPAISVEFLDTFKGLVIGEPEIGENLPVIHCYYFVSKGGDYGELAVNSVEKYLNCKLESNLVETTYVRDVAPNKEMVRVSFRIPKQVLIQQNNNSDEPPEKRICTYDKP